MPTVTYNRAEFSATLARDLGRELPWATVLALNATADDIRKAGRDDWIPHAFDRPTRFTVNAMRVVRASKATMAAEVLFKDRSTASIEGDAHYMQPQVRGGRRVHTPFESRLIRKGVMRPNEWAMPGKACRLDRHGNVATGVYAQVIAQLGLGDEGYNSAESARSRRFKERMAKAGNRPGRFFVADGRGLPRGIWERAGRSVAPVFIFAQRAPNYRIRLPWKAMADRLARARLPVHFRREAERLLRRRNH